MTEARLPATPAGRLGAQLRWEPKTTWAQDIELRVSGLGRHAIHPDGLHRCRHALTLNRRGNAHVVGLLSDPIGEHQISM